MNNGNPWTMDWEFWGVGGSNAGILDNVKENQFLSYHQMQVGKLLIATKLQEKEKEKKREKFKLNERENVNHRKELKAGQKNVQTNFLEVYFKTRGEGARGCSGMPKINCHPEL
eukprot:TRINITY_DN341_c6_g1_i1.p1 TRINITY_DN341_c6_g1~~TRINITY_DN341_c6_g1_i1.p1  ORF type:complete len:114 (-),score=14.03 TRINITY_DN341_c6_g1_i1:121-462(-)